MVQILKDHPFTAPARAIHGSIRPNIAALEVGDVAVFPYGIYPNQQSIRCTAGNLGRAEFKRFRCTKQPDGSLHVRRIA